jgi:CubicO group peptidase (beta-lactamase class C family)
VTKPLVAYAILVAIEEGRSISTLHSMSALRSGTCSLTHRGWRPTSEGSSLRRHSRIYSNAGFEVVGELLTTASGIDAGAYLEEAVLAPLGMQRTSLEGSPASGAASTATDLARSRPELLAPTLIAAATLDSATTCSSPASTVSSGLRPSLTQRLGARVRGARRQASALDRADRLAAHVRSLRPLGHILWVDPDSQVAVRYLGDADFGPWAASAWPAFSARVLEAAGG